MIVPPHTCPGCGGKVPRPRVGRPRREVAVENLIVAYREHRSVRAAARMLGIPPATAWDRLRDAGELPHRRP